MDTNDIMRDSNRALSVCFIILILLANSLLIFKTARACNFIYKPRSLIMISLATGDIIVALFPLVVLAGYYFQGPHFTTCATFRVSYTYMNSVIHSVYGFGLMAVAVETVYRYHIQKISEKTGKNIIITILCCAGVWIIGVAVCLSTSLIRADSCSQVTPWREGNIDMIIALAISFASLIVCATVVPIGLSPSLRSIHHALYRGDTPDVIMSSINEENPQYPINRNGSEVPTSPTIRCPTEYYMTEDKQCSSGTTQCFLPAAYHGQKFITHPCVVISEPVLHPVQTRFARAPILIDAGREKKFILIVSAVTFLCVAPQSVLMFSLGFRLPDYETNTAATILLAFFFWLSVFRSFITPVIWIVYSRGQQI